MQNNHNEPAILLQGVTVELGGRKILQDISVSIDPGELIVVLGPNGAGKTTFLKLLLGLVKPTAGVVRVLGMSPRRGLRRIGYAPQQRALDAEFNIRSRDLVGFGLDGHRWGVGLPNHERRDRIDQALSEVDALDLAEAPFGNLSGGEQQRLLIAQAMLSDPQLLLLDEPLSNLDLAHQHEAVSLIHKVCRTHQVTTVLVSHDINPLLSVTDRVLYMARSHCAIGSPDSVITSTTLSDLYNSPVEVVHALGRYFVIGAEI